ncbi:CDP-alcohol phosphatidyltransferase family protein [Sphingomonas rubra]|uniref:CDP-alcohol phosphatidyltransferase n=1 Tax=Sphingomonas rubra TaxID=634430 RepID=A0A1I5QVZ6_9SPHN|nr:CDP-alcohol phosphatidyltransferase family protein [Sphingomonas rubra]SFP50425.1 CDP-alcohol phosphatidyltransferase [Sphingomonas rubra]
MTVPAPDGSRDRRIEDPSNLWLIHPLGRRLLPAALRLGVSANAVSMIGLTLGTLAALAYADFERWPMAVLGLVLSVGWLVADGLDGMVARATGTASPLGRLLDGLCDHGVFILIYVALAWRWGTAGGWALAIAAGAAHAVQSSLYEGERARFHRRLKGIAQPRPPRSAGGALLRAYDRLAGIPERLARPFEHHLAEASDPREVGRRYADRAVPAMRLLSLETANVRVLAIFVASLLGDPRIFWWFEIVPLSAIAMIGLAWHRRVEQGLVFSTLSPAADNSARLFVKEQGQ